MKKSMTVIGNTVDHVYIIRDIKIGEITLDKYNVECRDNIVSTWESAETDYQNKDEKKVEIILKDKISTITLLAKANIVEMVAKMGGQIIKDINVEKGKGRSQKVYLTGIELFKETS